MCYWQAYRWCSCAPPAGARAAERDRSDCPAGRGEHDDARDDAPTRRPLSLRGERAGRDQPDLRARGANAIAVVRKPAGGHLPVRTTDARPRTAPGRAAGTVNRLLPRRRSGRRWRDVPPPQHLDRVTAAANAPVYCWVDCAMAHGVVGARLKDQSAEARAVGRLAARVLRGERADTIPIAAASLNVSQVDWRQLRRWGISEGPRPAWRPHPVQDALGIGRLIDHTSWERWPSAGAGGAHRRPARAAAEAPAGRGTRAAPSVGIARKLRAHPRPRRPPAQRAGNANGRRSPSSCTTTSDSSWPC